MTVSLQIITDVCCFQVAKLVQKELLLLLLLDIDVFVLLWKLWHCTMAAPDDAVLTKRIGPSLQRHCVTSCLAVERMRIPHFLFYTAH